MNKDQITVLLLISLITLTRLTQGGLELTPEEEVEAEIIREDPVLEVSTAEATACPTECFCNMIDHIITCIGDKMKSSLPTLSWLHKNYNNKNNNNYPNFTSTLLVRRLEIRDFILPELNLATSSVVESGDEKQSIGSSTSSLFQFVQELSLSHNQIKTIQPFSTSALEYYEENIGTSTTSNSESYLKGKSSSSSSSSLTISLLLLDLSSNNLTFFYSTKEFKLLKILDLSHNKISKLQLNELEKLESLNLKSNHIEELNEDIFQPLKSIQYINLDSNLLKKLSPNLFSNLPALAHLILSTNPLKLGSGFLFNSKTQFIDISNVGLEHIPSVMFRTVRDLRLNNNKLKRILESDFESYPNVGLLVLDENQIETIENDAFGRMDFLTSLWLNGNRLSTFPQNLPLSLKSLHLEENQITNLSMTSFTQLHNLETLNLHINLISSLDPEVFSPLYNLRSLNLGSNLIDTIYMDTFKNLSKLIHLDLSQNPIKVIVNRAFNHFPKLQFLHLARLNEKEIEFDPSIFDLLSLLEILDLSNSKYFTNKLIETNVLNRGWLKSLRELNIERCDLTIHLDNLCSQLLDFESLVNVKVQGNSFNRTSNSNSSVILRQVVTTVTSSTQESPNSDDSSNENHDGGGDNLNSLQKLCPTTTQENTKVKEKKKKKEAAAADATDRTRTSNTTTTTTTMVIVPAIQGDETSFLDLAKKAAEDVEEKKNNMSSSSSSKKVSLTLTITTTTTEKPLVIISSKVPKLLATNTTIVTTTTTTMTTARRNRPNSRPTKSNSTNTATIRRKYTSPTKKMQEESPTSSTSTSTSSYFESTTKKSKSKNYQETNEDTAGEKNGDTATAAVASPGRRKKKKEGSISIDGFPADLSGRTSKTGRRKTSSSNSRSNSNSNSTTSILQKHNDDFAKGSFHGLLPQKMYLSQALDGEEETEEEGTTPDKSLILKTVLISAGTCLLSVFILLAFGLVLFRINGGRFVRHTSRTANNEAPNESYKRLEDRQEMELGFSNKMYYDGGQVYHIS